MGPVLESLAQTRALLAIASLIVVYRLASAGVQDVNYRRQSIGQFMSSCQVLLKI